MSKRKQLDPREMELLGQVADASREAEEKTRKLLRAAHAFEKAFRASVRAKKRLVKYRLDKASEEGKEAFGGTAP